MATTSCDPPGGNTSGPCGSCPDHASCYEFADGPSCLCNPGFRPHGSSCVDVDECASGPFVCGEGICTNTVGSFECDCLNAPVQGRFCTPRLDVCRFAPVPCSRFAACGSGTFSDCTCFPGFFGDGTICNAAFDPNFVPVSVFESGIATSGSVVSSLGGAFDLDGLETDSSDDPPGCNAVDLPGGIDAGSVTWAQTVAPYFDLDLAVSRFGTVPVGAPLQMRIDLATAVGAPSGLSVATLGGSAMVSQVVGIGGATAARVDGVLETVTDVTFRDPVAFKLPIQLNSALCGGSGCVQDAAISIRLVAARLRFPRTRGTAGRDVWLSGVAFIDETDPGFPQIGILPAGAVLREELIGFGVDPGLAADAGRTLADAADSRVETDGSIEPCRVGSSGSDRNAVSMAFHFVLP